MTTPDEAGSWALKMFGKAALGDRRRVARLVAMAAQAATDPAGKITEVFRTDAERQGAYDFLESGHFVVASILGAMSVQAASSCASEARVLAAIDGSSLTLVDGDDTKDFGAIGAYAHGARGIKVVSAYAMTESGVPLGLLAQTFWTRPSVKPRKSKKRRARKVEEKETQRWIETINATTEALRSAAPNTRVWFQIDREGDSAPLLIALAESGQDFTVRGRWDREIDDRLGRLRRKLAYSATKGTYDLDVPKGPKRTARTASMMVSAVEVTVTLKHPSTGKPTAQTLTAILAREVSAVPNGEARIEWLLLTNTKVADIDDAMYVISCYAKRWRIEEFHKTWKSGACRVEESQLRSKEAVLRWATILAAVAVRIERLKYLSRVEPTLPASAELTPLEIELIILLKRKHKKRTETIPLGIAPTIADVTRWIAELGGYTGKSSGGPAGTIVLRRGLERLHHALQGFSLARGLPVKM